MKSIPYGSATWIILMIFSFSVSAEENVPYQTAIDAGIKRCLSGVKQTSEYIIEDRGHGAHSIWGVPNANNTLFTTTIESVYDDASVISSITLAPVLSGKCEAVITQISHRDHSCLKLEKSSYPNGEIQGLLAERVKIIKNGTTYVYTVPTNPGCMFMKKETVIFTPQDAEKPSGK